MPKAKRKSYPLVIVSKATRIASGTPAFQETQRCKELLDLAMLAQKGVLTGTQTAALIRDIALKQYRRGGSRTS